MDNDRMRIVNNGKGSQPKEDRDKKLIADYELVRNGEKKMLDLVIKYRISHSRIGQILNKYEVKRIKK